MYPSFYIRISEAFGYMWNSCFVFLVIFHYIWIGGDNATYFIYFTTFKTPRPLPDPSYILIYEHIQFIMYS